MSRLDQQASAAATVGRRRRLTIDEVHVENNVVTGKDQYGQTFQLTFGPYHDPVITIPKQGENWVVEQYKQEWRLKHKVEDLSKFPSLAPGDKAIAAGTLWINGGVEIDNGFLTLQDPTAPQHAATKNYVDTLITATEANEVLSVFGRTGAVSAQTGDYTVGQITGAAPLDSPTFTGVPAAPTPATGDNSTKLATTAFVKNQGYVTPTTSPVTSVFSRTGAIVAASGDYSVSQITGAAPLASPTFTGDPKAPTPATGDNDTSIATTAFVKAQGYVTSTTAPVTSVFGRTGAVVAVTNDYTAAQVTNAADKASGSQQAFSGPISSPSWIVSNDHFQVNQTVATAWTFYTTVTGDTQPRFLTQAGGQLNWGPGGSTAPDTTLYRSAANMLTTDGSLGIGTGATAPANTVEIATNSTVDPTNGSLKGLSITNQNTTSSALDGILFRTWDTTNAPRHTGSIVAGPESAWTGGSGVYPGFLSFWTRTSGSNEAEAMRITSAQYVGIGTTSPKTRLQVNAKVVDDNSFSYDSNSLTVIHQTPTATATLNDPKTTLMLARQGTAGQAYGAAAAFNLSRYENVSTNSRTRLDISLAHGSFDVTSNTAMTLLSSGNVGIGETNPSNKLQLASSTSSTGGIGFGADTNLYRESANILKTAGYFKAGSYIQANADAAGATILGYVNGSTASGLSLGTGSAWDTNLYRWTAGWLGTDSTLVVNNTTGIYTIGNSGGVIRHLLTASDANPNFVMDYLGRLNWGPGGAGATDTTLARVDVGILQLGTTTQSGNFRLNSQATGNAVFQTFVTTDANPRLSITSDGRLNWGPGSTATDTTLQRSSPGILDFSTSSSGANGGMRIFTPAAASSTLLVYKTTDAQPSFQIVNDGRMNWGPGGSTAADTNLYRAAASDLRTDGIFRAANAVVVDQGNSNGRLYFGSALDASLYRLGAGVIQTDRMGLTGTSGFAVGSTRALTVNRIYSAGSAIDGLRVQGVVNTSVMSYADFGVTYDATGYAYGAIAGNGNEVLTWDASGTPGLNGFVNIVGTTKLGFGATNATTAPDTTLYRSSANTLKTDGTFNAVTAIQRNGTPIVYSFNSRTGAVSPASGDYTAAQVTNAADKSSVSTQAFSADVTTTGQFMASGGYAFRSNIANTSSWAHAVTVQGTTGNAIFGIFGQQLLWADPGGASATDTSLYRNAANQLRTGGYFQADSAIMATGGNSTIGTGAVLQGNNTYNAGNNWMSGMVGSGIYYDGANWQNKTFGGNNGWAAMATRGASTPGGFDFYGVNATGSTDRSYTPAQFIAQNFGSWTTDGVLTTLGRVFSGAPSTGGIWVDGVSGNSQFVGSQSSTLMGLYNSGWQFLVSSGGKFTLGGAADTFIQGKYSEAGSIQLSGSNNWGVLYLGGTAGGYIRPLGQGLRICDGGTGSVAQVGFFGATPVAQQTAHAVTTNTRGVGTTWLIDNTTTGGVGSTAYTIQDIVAAMKNLGLLAA